MVRNTHLWQLMSPVMLVVTSLLIPVVVMVSVDPKPTYLPSSTLPDDIQRVMDAVDTIRRDRPRTSGIKSSTETAVELMEALERELESRKRDFQRKVKEGDAKLIDVKDISGYGGSRVEPVRPRGDRRTREYYKRNSRDSSHDSYERRPNSKYSTGQRYDFTPRHQHPDRQRQWDSSERDGEMSKNYREKAHYNNERSDRTHKRSKYNNEKSLHNAKSSKYSHEESKYDKKKSKYNKQRPNYDNGKFENHHKNSKYEKRGSRFDKERSMYEKERSKYSKNRSKYDKERSKYDRERSNYDKEGSNYNNERSEYNNEPLTDSREYESKRLRDRNYNRDRKLSNHDKKAKSNVNRKFHSSSTGLQQDSFLLVNNRGKPIFGAKNYADSTKRNVQEDEGYSRNQPREIPSRHSRGHHQSYQGDQRYNDTGFRNGEETYRYRNNDMAEGPMEYHDRNSSRHYNGHQNQNHRDYHGDTSGYDSHYHGDRSADNQKLYNSDGKRENGDASHYHDTDEQIQHNKYDRQYRKHISNNKSGKHRNSNRGRKVYQDRDHSNRKSQRGPIMNLHHSNKEVKNPPRPDYSNPKKHGNNRPRPQEHNSERGDDVSIHDRDVSQLGRDVSERGHDVSERGRDVSERGRIVSERGRDVIKRGRDVSERGRDVSERGDDVSIHERDVSERGRDVRKLGRDVIKRGRDVRKRGHDVTDDVDDVRRIPPIGKSLKQMYTSREDHGGWSTLPDHQEPRRPTKKSVLHKAPSSSSYSSSSSSSFSSSDESDHPFPILNKPEHKALIPSQPEQLQMLQPLVGPQGRSLGSFMGDDGGVERYDPEKHHLPVFTYDEGNMKAFYNGTHRPCYKCSWSPDKPEVTDGARKVGWDRCRYAFHHEDATIFGIQVIDCVDNCYVRVDEKNNVHRGCYRGEYGVNPEILGCNKQGADGAVFCFCEGPKCNTANSPVFF